MFGGNIASEIEFWLDTGSEKIWSMEFFLMEALKG